MKLNHRITALVLALLIIFVSIPAFAIAYGSESENPDVSEPDVPFSFTLEEGDLTFSELKTAVLDPADIPDVISPSLAAERDHVNRLYAQEPDDHTVMFQNRDGSKTTYVFSKPVKSGRSSLSAEALSGRIIPDAFSFSSRGLEYKSTSSLRALDRLDKECPDGKIYYYNIGYAEITKTAGRLDSAGTEITEDVREWSRGKVIPGDRLSAPSGQAVNEEAPGSYVLMYTASEMAGIVNLKNFYTMSYLKNNYQTPMLTSANSNTLKTPAFRWVLQYCNTYRYLIKSMVNVYASSQYLLKYNSTFTSISISTGNSSYGMWIIDAEEDDDEIMYFYLRPAMSGGSGKGLNNNLGFSNVTTGSCNDYCGWELLNKRDIPASITTKQYAVIAVGEDISNVLTVIPANAETLFFWDSDHNALFEYNDDYGYISYSGKHHIWMEEKYSGITVEDDEDWYVLAYDDYNVYDNNRTYMIRPYISSNTDYATSDILTLTKTSDPDTNSISAIPLYNGNGTTYSAKWTDKSQTFTFSYTEDGKYKIGATLAAEQYAKVPAYTDESSYNTSNHETYKMTYQSNVQNWLGSNGGTAVEENDGSSWYIIPDGTLQTGGQNYGKYIIVRADQYQDTYALKNVAGTVSVGSIWDSTSFDWIINKVGINVPLIKQTRTYWCGYATFLQTIYGAKKENSLITAINSPSNSDQLHKQQSELFNWFGHGGMLNQNFFCSDVNGGIIIPSTVFDSNAYAYNRIPAYDENDPYSTITFHDVVQGQNAINDFVNYLKTSFNTGWAPFFMTSTGGAPYKIEPGDAHYISITGYDSISQVVLISNCHYCDGEITYNNHAVYIYGNYAVNVSTIYNNIDKLFYSIPIN